MPLATLTEPSQAVMGQGRMTAVVLSRINKSRNMSMSLDWSRFEFATVDRFFVAVSGLHAVLGQGAFQRTTQICWQVMFNDIVSWRELSSRGMALRKKVPR